MVGFSGQRAAVAALLMLAAVVPSSASVVDLLAAADWTQQDVGGIHRELLQHVAVNLSNAHQQTVRFAAAAPPSALLHRAVRCIRSTPHRDCKCRQRVCTDSCTYIAHSILARPPKRLLAAWHPRRRADGVQGSRANSRKLSWELCVAGEPNAYTRPA